MPSEQELRWGESIFGRWTVLRNALNRGGRRYWSCRCACGTVRDVEPHHLRSGRSKSCGCLKNELTSERHTKHGCSGKHPLYYVWNAMKQRCCNPRVPEYRYYGALGVKVCERWRASFSDFLDDVGERPGQGMSLDRIDPFGNYEPGNVRWATAKQQNNNLRYQRLGTARRSPS